MTKKTETLKELDGAVRPVIDNVKPALGNGRYPAKRIAGEPVQVEATLFVDGHEQLAARLLYKHEADRSWSEAPLTFLGKRDIWGATFTPDRPGAYRFSIEAWISRFETWRNEFAKRVEAKQDVRVDLRIGAAFVADAARRAKGSDKTALAAMARLMEKEGRGPTAPKRSVQTALSDRLTRLMARHPDRSYSARYSREMPLLVERPKARFSAWYEFFPRSASLDGKRHGTFRDAEKLIPYVASMGFDVIYLPPIHPIGTTFRKGKNNSLTAGPNDPGSPWGIGGKKGGHKSIHPELGTLADFKRLVSRARKHGIEIALDIAFQCAPEHPYVKAHPSWFKKRPDGTIQYAENPPKKYQDIYPFNFESRDWPALWMELKSVVEFWASHGVRIFRVDNPHTKSVRFWEWMMAEVRRTYPDAIFLAEAFTRPAMMYHLAKIGFSQSYTYFTWRNTKKEFREYLDELTKTEVAEFYRPNFWPNTPDILPGHLQKSGRPAFLTRVALAATLSSNYGVYGPAYELLDNQAMHENSEEYLNSEKYELRAWDLQSKKSIRDWLKRLNGIRKANPALQENRHVEFHETSTDAVLAYSKQTEDRKNTVLVLANLDFHAPQSARVDLALAALGFSADSPIAAEDLITGQRHVWRGAQQNVSLDPNKNPVAIYRLSQRNARPAQRARKASRKSR